MAYSLSLTLKGTLSGTAPFANVTFGGLTRALSVTGKNSSCGTQNIGTTDETLPLGDVGTDIGGVYIANNDPTNYVSVGVDGTNYTNKVKPGSAMYSEWLGSAVHVKANSAAVDIQFAIIQN